MPSSVLLSTARGKDVNARSLITYLVGSVLTPIAAGTATPTRYRCARTELHCGNGGGVDVYLAVHNQHRSTFLEQSAYLYGAMLEVCPQLSISIIPVIGSAGEAAAAARGESTPPPSSSSSAPSPPPPHGDGGGDGGLSVYEDVAALLREWRLVDSGALRESDGFRPYYGYVAVGGTFDHFHSGHKVLLSTAALHAMQKLRVGVTDASLLTKKKFAESLQPMDLRMQHVAQFLRKVRPDLDLEVAPISEMSGGTKDIAEVEALVVSPETASALGVINDMRAANGGMAPMVGIAIPQVQSSSGESISSTALRERLRQ
ncbi:Cytidylyltransferase [Novymonas esmeraldas]|uniref:Cytidylyltransferase n=1 Tax=Novymonas esmeraldas TaxID=1808958 RepID=A0AAW0F328_9TRYP